MTSEKCKAEHAGVQAGRRTNVGRYSPALGARFQQCFLLGLPPCPGLQGWRGERNRLRCLHCARSSYPPVGEAPIVHLPPEPTILPGAAKWPPEG